MTKQERMALAEELARVALEHFDPYLEARVVSPEEQRNLAYELADVLEREIA